jgi:hypothetical protein
LDAVDYLGVGDGPHRLRENLDRKVAVDDDGDRCLRYAL